MKPADVSLLIITLLFAVYGWLSLIEFGVALARLRPATPKAMTVLRYFTPLWEITNVFLVFGATGLAVLFNNGLSAISHLIFSTVIIGVVCLVLRAIVVLEIFYRRPQLGPTLPNHLFAALSAIVPLSFAAAGITLLTGRPIWQSFAGGCLLTIAVLLYFSGGLSFAAFINKDRSRRHASGAMAGVALNGLGLFVMLPTLQNEVAGLQRFALCMLALVFFIGIIIHAASIWHRHPKWSWYHNTALSLFLPACLAGANRPFLIHNRVLITQAYGAQAYSTAANVGLLVMAPVMLLGLALFASLLTHKN